MPALAASLRGSRRLARAVRTRQGSEGTGRAVWDRAMFGTATYQHLPKKLRVAGSHTSPSIAATGLVEIVARCDALPADFDTAGYVYTLALERSTDGEQSWQGLASAVIRAGGRDKSGAMPWVSVRPQTGTFQGVYRTVLTASNDVVIGLTGSLL